MLPAAFALLAALVAAVLFINVIRLIALIVLIGAAIIIVATLIGLALVARHYRAIERAEQASALPRAQSAVPTGSTLAAAGEPAAGFAEIALLGRVLSKTEERIARQFADAVADGTDLPAINELISKVLRDHDT
jgi:hypothetical protein